MTPSRRLQAEGSIISLRVPSLLHACTIAVRGGVLPNVPAWSLADYDCVRLRLLVIKAPLVYLVSMSRSERGGDGSIPSWSLTGLSCFGPRAAEAATVSAFGTYRLTHSHDSVTGARATEVGEEAVRLRLVAGPAIHCDCWHFDASHGSGLEFSCLVLRDGLREPWCPSISQHSSIGEHVTLGTWWGRFKPVMEP